MVVGVGGWGGGGGGARRKWGSGEMRPPWMGGCTCSLGSCRAGAEVQGPPKGPARGAGGQRQRRASPRHMLQAPATSTAPHLSCTPCHSTLTATVAQWPRSAGVLLVPSSSARDMSCCRLVGLNRAFSKQIMDPCRRASTISAWRAACAPGAGAWAAPAPAAICRSTDDRRPTTVR